MKEILAPLLKLLDDAKLTAATRRPDKGEDPAYLMGRLQGTYLGIQQALDTVQRTLGEADDT